MSKLYYPAHTSFSGAAAEVPYMWSCWTGSEEMSRMCGSYYSLLRFRYRKGRRHCPEAFPKSSVGTDGFGYDGTKRRLSTNPWRFSEWTDRHSHRYTNDRQGPRFSLYLLGGHHQCRYRLAFARLSSRRTYFPAAHPGRWPGRKRRDHRRSFCADIYAVQSLDPICAASRL